MKLGWYYTDGPFRDMHGQLPLSFEIENFSSYLRPGSGYKLWLITGDCPSRYTRHFIDTLPTRKDARQLAQILIDENPQAWKEE